MGGTFSACLGRRVMRALQGSVAWLALLSGCAARPAPVTAPVADVELERMRIVLAEREQLIEELHGRLALLEAARRTDSDSTYGREPVCPEPEPEAYVSTVAPTRTVDEPRPVLRLHGERLVEARAPHVAWEPPRTQDRLAVAPVPALPTAHPGPGEAEGLYVQALDLIRKRDFRAALRELDAFLRTFPGDARTVRALYWRGEVLFALREYASALSAYEEVLEREPRGERAADALLRVARCQLRLGAAERARSTLSELRGRFPQSEAARASVALEQEDS